ncbi:MAG: glycoside hydrolase family 3 N-terminal domain-containing protein [Clostridia bacterium]|nr:glycoside hydrolase family 3 N-terminal domain-containing protein [Clostridia bacterium]
MDKFRDSSLSPKERAEDLLKRLTLKEKVGQVNQRLYGFEAFKCNGDNVELSKTFCDEVEKWGGLGTLYGLYRADPWADKDYDTGLSDDKAIRAYNMAQKYIMDHSRFGIPMLMSTECPHGHQALDGYLLPTNLGMGAAWNPKLIEDGFSVVGEQIKEMGVDFALVSMLDVLRDPRWGRSEECYGEDPYLSARNAEACVKGCLNAGVDAVSKHFCAQGETTGGVNASAARIGERELREIHFPAMEAAAKAGAKGVMAAYNEIDGVPCHANKWLLQDVLRGEMGFDGIVMADGVALDRLSVLTGGDYAANAGMALDAGVDVSLWDESFSHLEEAVERGLVSEELLDRAVLRVLELKFERGLFEHPYLEEKELTDYNNPEKYPQSLEIARQAAVLLKNNGILPLTEVKSVAVIGPNADAIYHMLGDYTPPLRDGVGATVLDGIRKEFPNAEIKFAQGSTICDEDTSGIAQAVKLAEESDVVILALGGSSSRFGGAEFDNNGAAIIGKGKLQMDCGEGVDTSTLRLPGVQNELAEAVFATGKPVVTVIVSGRPHVVTEIAEKSDALIWSFYPGPWGGQAIAEVIRGTVNPSGCLPTSIPREEGQVPCYYNARASYDPMKYRNIDNTPLYPFGFGLHYSDFAVLDTECTASISVNELRAGESAKVSCNVVNIGKISGHATLQLYIQAKNGSIVRRVKELKGFDKIYLEPGEEKRVELSLSLNELGVWNRQMKFDAEPSLIHLYLEESGRTVWDGELKITAE